MEHVMHDWRGASIVPGATIVYPVRHASSMWMVEAKVLSIVETNHWGIKVKGLKVQPIRQGTYGRTNMKPVTLTALERVTVIPETRTEVILDQATVAALIH